MKFVIMTEGTCEKALIDVLIKKEMFKIPIDSLLYEQVFHARQIKNSLLEKINQLPISEKITIIRIGDLLSDELVIPFDIKDRIESCLKVCIKPEFEILHLIYKKEDNSYLRKYKSKKKPSEYLKEIDDCYEKTYDYNFLFFDNLSSNELINLIKSYSMARKLVHKKDELILEDLLK